MGRRTRALEDLVVRERTDDQRRRRGAGQRRLGACDAYSLGCGPRAPAFCLLDEGMWELCVYLDSGFGTQIIEHRRSGSWRERPGVRRPSTITGPRSPRPTAFSSPPTTPFRSTHLLPLSIARNDHHRRKVTGHERRPSPLRGPPAVPSNLQAPAHPRHAITTSPVADSPRAVPTGTLCRQRKGRTPAYDLVLSEHLFAPGK